MAQIVSAMLFTLIVADVLFGGIVMFVTWVFWRDHVGFKRRHSFSDPMSFAEFRYWLRRRRVC